MAEKYRNTPGVQERQMVTEEIWLNYFNAVLYEKNLISERQRNQMINKIANGKPSATKQKHQELEL